MNKLYLFNNKQGILRFTSLMPNLTNTILIVLISVFSFIQNVNAQSDVKKFTISGKIKDKSTSETLIGATIRVKDDEKIGAVADENGYFKITLPQGIHTLIITYVGYKPIERSVNVISNTTLNFDVESNNNDVKEVVVTSERKNDNITKNEMSTFKLDAKMISKIPAFMGEVDVIKAIQLLPGVLVASEGSSGYSVRGGGRDQNMTLLDGASVYSSSHLMGFFSVFNNDALKEVKLYKGDMPSEYGGRISSLLDIKMKDGDLQKFHANGGIGIISSRLTIEGPIQKDKSSFMISGRRMYADLFLPLSTNKALQNNKLHFYDLNAKLTYVLSPKDRLSLSGYYGRDVFQFGKTNPFGLEWGNTTVSARWNHLFSDKCYSNIAYYFSEFDYSLGQTGTFKWVSKISDHTLKADLTYLLPKNNLKIGIISTYHQFSPAVFSGSGFFNNISVPTSDAIETAVFAENEQTVTDRISLTYGLRYSMFNCIGASTIYNFNENHDTTATTYTKRGEIYKTYGGFEPRITFKYLLNEFSSIKGSYARNLQYVHLASNTTAGSPLDVWVPSSPNTKPQIGDQFAVGYFRNLKNNMFETSVEVYYKQLQNQIDFADHAQLMLNPLLEGTFRTGTGTAYGAEFLIRKQTGKLTGWVAYTYSHAERKIAEINDGKPFTAPYDKPHNISIVSTYEFTKTLSASVTWVYSTGAVGTFPAARFEYGNAILPLYTERNSYRMPDYHRMDVSLNWSLNRDDKQWFRHSLNLSVYNVYNRKNAYLITFANDPNDPNKKIATMVYLFPIIPTLTYNFNF